MLVHAIFYHLYFLTHIYSHYFFFLIVFWYYIIYILAFMFIIYIDFYYRYKSLLRNSNMSIDRLIAMEKKKQIEKEDKCMQMNSITKLNLICRLLIIFIKKISRTWSKSDRSKFFILKSDGSEWLTNVLAHAAGNVFCGLRPVGAPFLQKLNYEYITALGKSN